MFYVFDIWIWVTIPKLVIDECNGHHLSLVLATYELNPYIKQTYKDITLYSEFNFISKYLLAQRWSSENEHLLSMKGDLILDFSSLISLSIATMLLL